MNISQGTWEGEIIIFWDELSRDGVLKRIYLKKSNCTWFLKIDQYTRAVFK